MTAPRRLAIALGLGVALLVAVLALNRAPRGPLEPAWDREACAHCRMHLGERGFAAQALTTDGETLFFDDPGCLILWQAQAARAPAAAWFHHVAQERWIPAAEVGFVSAESTPMDWGLAAVDAGTATAISLTEAEKRVTARAAGGARTEAGAEP